MSEHGATFFSWWLGLLWEFVDICSYHEKKIVCWWTLKTASFAYFLVSFLLLFVSLFVIIMMLLFDEDKYKSISSLHSKTDNLIVSKSRSVHYTNTSGKCIRPFTSEWNLVSYYILRSERAKINFKLKMVWMKIRKIISLTLFMHMLCETFTFLSAAYKASIILPSKLSSFIMLINIMTII